MTGYMFVTGYCGACGALINFNPIYVPAIRIKGEKVQICRTCFERWKKLHNSDMKLYPNAYEPQEVS